MRAAAGRVLPRQQQRRSFRPQGMAIPDEHLPPMEGQPEFDREVNDYYTLRLNKSFWSKDLRARFLPVEEREKVRERVAARQLRFSAVRRATVVNQEPSLKDKAAALITKQYGDMPAAHAEFKKGDRIVPLAGPMKDQVATVLGFRDHLMWHQFDGHPAPVPIHPSAVKGWILVGTCLPEGDLPDAPTEAAAGLTAGTPVIMPKSKQSNNDDDESEMQAGESAAASAAEDIVKATEDAKAKAAQAEEAAAAQDKANMAEPAKEEHSSDAAVAADAKSSGETSAAAGDEAKGTEASAEADKTQPESEAPAPGPDAAASPETAPSTEPADPPTGDAAPVATQGDDGSPKAEEAAPLAEADASLKAKESTDAQPASSPADSSSDRLSTAAAPDTELVADAAVAEADAPAPTAAIPEDEATQATSTAADSSNAQLSTSPDTPPSEKPTPDAVMKEADPPAVEGAAPIPQAEAPRTPELSVDAVEEPRKEGEALPAQPAARTGNADPTSDAVTVDVEAGKPATVAEEGASTDHHDDSKSLKLTIDKAPDTAREDKAPETTGQETTNPETTPQSTGKAAPSSEPGNNAAPAEPEPPAKPEDDGKPAQ